MDWPDFDLSFPDVEWDNRAAGISVGACLLIGSFMFSENFGWADFPLWIKIAIIGVGLPVWYYVALYMINKE